MKKVNSKAKKAVKKVVKKVTKKAAKLKVPKNFIGHVTHYYGGIGVAIIKLAKPIVGGITIRIAGATTNFIQPVESMQLDHVAVLKAKKGDEVGIKIKDRARDGDEVYLVERKK